MKYRDRNTIQMGRKQQEKNIYSYDDQYERRLKMALKELGNKITDKLWWQSLNNSEKESVYHKYTHAYMMYHKTDKKWFTKFESKVKIEFIGDLNKKRELVINKLIK